MGPSRWVAAANLSGPLKFTGLGEYLAERLDGLERGRRIPVVRRKPEELNPGAFVGGDRPLTQCNRFRMVGNSHLPNIPRIACCALRVRLGSE